MNDLPDPYPELSDRTIEVSYEELRTIAEEDRGKEKDSTVTVTYLVTSTLKLFKLVCIYYLYVYIVYIMYLSTIFMYIWQGTHVKIHKFIYDVWESNFTWHRSKEPIPINEGFVGGGYMSNKKWPLLEVRYIFLTLLTLTSSVHFVFLIQLMSIHLLAMQQV